MSWSETSDCLLDGHVVLQASLMDCERVEKPSHHLLHTYLKRYGYRYRWLIYVILSYIHTMQYLNESVYVMYLHMICVLCIHMYLWLWPYSLIRMYLWIHMYVPTIWLHGRHLVPTDIQTYIFSADEDNVSETVIWKADAMMSCFPIPIISNQSTTFPLGTSAHLPTVDRGTQFTL